MINIIKQSKILRIYHHPYDSSIRHNSVVFTA